MKKYLAASLLLATPAFAAGSPNYYDPLPGATAGSIPASAIIAPGNDRQTIINSGGLLVGSDIISASAINSSGTITINSVGNMILARNGAAQLTVGTNTMSTISAFVVGGINNVITSIGVGIGSATPSATLHVSGTAYMTGRVSLTTGPLHLGSPTTIPTCDATNKGNIYINTTTNCLTYCDGTANRQVTSAAASCT